MRRGMILVLFFAFGCMFFEPSPVQAVEQPSDLSQAYLSVTPRMSKKEVLQVMGKPSQSTDMLWVYTHEDGTIVEITFSKQRRVTQVVNYKKKPKK